MTRTLLLDLDGTLVHSVPDLAAALNRLMAARGLAGFSHARDGVDGGRWRGDADRSAPSPPAAGRADEGAVAAFSADYVQHSAVDSRPYPGVADGLRALADEGWRLAVCTNKPERAARALLSALGLASLFAAIGGGDSFPVRKPDPAHLLATLAAAGGEPAHAVMAGDHANDVAAARGAGVPCIFAGWGYGPPAMAEGAVAVAQDFAEMVTIARRLLA